MRIIQELSQLAGKIPGARFLAAAASCLCISAIIGCGVKEQIRFEVPEKIVQAKTAGLDELLAIVESYNRIEDLKCSRLNLTLIEGKFESGTLDKYKNAPGYVLLRRPDSIRLVIQDPVMNFPQVDLLSTGDDFSLYIKSRKEFYTGKNSADKLFAEDLPHSPEISIRPSHFFEAFLPEPLGIDSPGTWVCMEEDMDEHAKFYVLSLLREERSPAIQILRKIWIERSSMTISKRRIFGEEGQVVSDIVYSDMVLEDGIALPLGIRMNRPEDGYIMEMKFERENWRINSGIKDDAFILKPPEGARIISLRERERSGDL